MNAENFDEMVMASKDFWVVVFMGGKSCSKCNDARANIFRLAGELAGIGRIGMVSCPQNAALCAKHDAKDDHPRFKGNLPKDIGVPLRSVYSLLYLL